MPRQTEISIERQNLGGLETVPDLALVKVLINGAVADVIQAERDAIEVKAPAMGNGPWTILLITPDGKKLLCSLDLNYDPKAETFDVKQQQGLGAKEPTSDDKVDKAADKIATAIRKAALGNKVDRAADKIAKAIRDAALALSSGEPAEGEKNK